MVITSKIDDEILKLTSSLKLNDYSSINHNNNKINFRTMGYESRQFTRKYVNEWNDLREYIGFHDVESENNELLLVNPSVELTQNRLSVIGMNYNILRIISGMSGVCYST